MERARGPMRTEEQFAQGILDVANSVMGKAIRVISVERGHDPRDYTLVAFGGAGALHACDLASALEIPRVLVPCFPGALSALGILRADVAKDLSHTIRLEVRSASQFRGKLLKEFAALVREGHAQMRAEGFAPGSVRIDRTLDMRYAGQSYDLTVPFAGITWLPSIARMNSAMAIPTEPDLAKWLTFARASRGACRNRVFRN